MGCLEQGTKLHTTWDKSKYGNIVKIHNKNGEYPIICQNVDGKNTNLETKNATKTDIQIALQMGVKLCLPSYDLSVASVECEISN